MSISTLNNMDFWNTVNQKYNGFIDPQDQHNFIYNYMLPTLKTILSEVKDSLVTSDENTTMLGLSVHSISPFQNVPFKWDDFYQNLALAGLQNCSSFQKEIGTFDASGYPLIIKDQIKMDFFNQYISFGNVNLHH